MVMDQLSKFVRAEVRAHYTLLSSGADPAEEFFKLCIELGPNDSRFSAHAIRRDVLSELNQEGRKKRA